jgi:hypothetical protein
MSNHETRGTPQFFLPDFSGAKGTKGAFFVDYTRPIGDAVEFYEIKPNSYMSSNKGDKQLEKYVDRARTRGLNAVKGTSLLSAVNGRKITTSMFEGEVIDPDQLGFITLRADPENHPGMIFYELDDGKRETNYLKQLLEKIIPIGVPESAPVPAPSFELMPVPAQ